MSAKLIWITPEAEKMIMRIARVSSKNQNSDNPKLLKYLIRNKHWSPFEMANLCVEIKTSRTIARQILRHRSFSFQEFSQRYQSVSEMETIIPEIRMQDEKNRQNSFELKEIELTEKQKEQFEEYQNFMKSTHEKILANYSKMLESGIAKEVARSILPEGMTPTKMYMNGNIRSWIHYLELRCGNGTQKEHRLVAEEIKKIFIEQLPIISEAIGWK